MFPWTYELINIVLSTYKESTQYLQKKSTEYSQGKYSVRTRGVFSIDQGKYSALIRKVPTPTQYLQGKYRSREVLGS